MIDKIEKIVKYMAINKLTIATMESCTGGQLASEITNVYGASSILSESYVTYSNDAKIKRGVSSNIIDKYSVYSKNVASEMATVVKKEAKVNIGIGITGQLGTIDPNNNQDTLNKVWYAIDYKKKYVKMVEVPNLNRRKQKEFVIKSVIDDLFNILEITKI